MGGKGGSIEVAAGLAVQSEYSGLIDNTYGTWQNMHGGSSGVGYAQTNANEISTLGLGDLNPLNPADSVKVMDARIAEPLSACGTNGCSSKDKLIIAALAQNRNIASSDVNFLKSNGPNFDWKAFLDSKRDEPKQSDANFRQNVTGIYYNSYFQLLKYVQDMRELYRQGWKLPDGISASDLGDLEEFARSNGNSDHKD
jgi:hypothetical protein